MPRNRQALVSLILWLCIPTACSVAPPKPMDPPAPPHQLSGPATAVAPFEAVDLTADTALPPDPLLVDVGGTSLVAKRVDDRTLTLFAPDLEAGEYRVSLVAGDQVFEGLLRVEEVFGGLEPVAYLTTVAARGRARLDRSSEQLDALALADPTLDLAEAREILSASRSLLVESELDFGRMSPEEQSLVARLIAANAESMGVPTANRGKFEDELDAFLADPLNLSELNFSDAVASVNAKVSRLGLFAGAFLARARLLKAFEASVTGTMAAGRIVNSIIQVLGSLPTGRLARLILSVALAVTVGAIIGYTIGLYRQFTSLPLVPKPPLVVPARLAFRNAVPQSIAVRATYHSLTPSEVRSLPALSGLAAETAFLQERIDELNRSVLGRVVQIGPLLTDRMVRREKAPPVDQLNVTYAVETSGAALMFASAVSGTEWQATFSKTPAPTSDQLFEFDVALTAPGALPTVETRVQATLKAVSACDGFDPLIPGNWTTVYFLNGAFYQEDKIVLYAGGTGKRLSTRNTQMTTNHQGSWGTDAFYDLAWTLSPQNGTCVMAWRDMRWGQNVTAVLTMPLGAADSVFGSFTTTTSKD